MAFAVNYCVTIICENVHGLGSALPDSLLAWPRVVNYTGNGWGRFESANQHQLTKEDDLVDRATWAILICLTFLGLSTLQVAAQEPDPAEPTSDPAAEGSLDKSAGETLPVESDEPEGTNWLFILSVAVGFIGLVLFIVVEVLRAKWKQEESEEEEEKEEEPEEPEEADEEMDEQIGEELEGMDDEMGGEIGEEMDGMGDEMGGEIGEEIDGMGDEMGGEIGEEMDGMGDEAEREA